MDDDSAQVIARAAAEDREARHASAHELAADLRALLPRTLGARVRHLLLASGLRVASQILTAGHALPAQPSGSPGE